MTMMELRRRIMMAQREHWDYVYQCRTGGYLLDVTEGQTLVVDWDVSDSNLNGWILNGNGCTENIGQVRKVGTKGQQTLTVTVSGKVRVGAYSDAVTFSAVNGVIKIRIL